MEILRQKNPPLAEFLELWKSKYEGVHDFEGNEQRAKFYEGVLEIARFIAATSQSASVKLGVSTEGVDSLQIQVVPLPKPKVAE